MVAQEHEFPALDVCAEVMASGRRLPRHRYRPRYRYRHRHRRRHPAKTDALLLQPQRRLTQPTPAQIIVEPALGLVQPRQVALGGLGLVGPLDGRTCEDICAKSNSSRRPQLATRESAQTCFCR